MSYVPQLETIDEEYLSFHLPEDFIAGYADRQPPFGFPIGGGNTLGELTYLSKYSRRKEDGSRERWHETCRRVIEGMYSILRDHCETNRTPWNEQKAQRSAKQAFDRLYELKWTPPGRGLWVMGTEFVNGKRNSAALQSCAFISTEKLSVHSQNEATLPFMRLMEMSMLGVGVGFDTKGAGNLTIHEPTDERVVVTIDDSREGWYESVGTLLASYFFKNRPTIEFDYSLIRPAGVPIKGFGGVAAGPGPLIALHDSIRDQFNGRWGESISSTDVVDLMNKIGKCLPADTWIMTTQGPRQVKDLVGVPFDAVVDGLAYHSDGFWKTGTKAVYEVQTASGTFRATAEHQVFANSGWVEVQDLHVEDELRLHEHGDLTWGGKGDAGQGYVLGHLVGDGSIRNTPWGEMAQLYVWDQDAGHEGPKKLIEQVIASMPHRSDWKGWRLNGGRGRWQIQSKAVTRLAAEFGIRRGNKTVTAEVEMGSSDFAIGFLRGLFDADGSVNPAARSVTLPQSDESTLRAVQRMLRRLGIHSLLRGPYRDKEYVLYIGGSNAARFMDRVGFENTRKTSDYFLTPWKRGPYAQSNVGVVEAVTYVGEEEVFDCEVELVHAFDADGFYVHNCVVSGNVRRSAEIALGDADDKEFLDLKDWERNPQRMGENGWGYTSNNSVFAEVGGDYDHLVGRIVNNGEPGLLYLDLCREFGRLADPPNGKDRRVAGTNPCSEQSLESFECCTLVETFPSRHDSLDDYLVTLKFAYLYGKAVTLLPTHWAETNEVMQRNRRIGCSVSGVAQFAERHGWTELKRWLNAGYESVIARDVQYSEWLGVRESIKTTSVKPSGTVSLLAGVTPGVHWPTDDIYIRRMRLSANDPLISVLQEAGYYVEPDFMNPTHDVVVELPTLGPEVRTEREVSVWEKASLAALTQRFWADNQVSVTLTFRRDEENQVGAILRAFDGQLKSVSFLPMPEEGEVVYRQAPYERISADRYDEMVAPLQPIAWDVLYAGNSLDAAGEKFCTNDRCELK